jgi:RNA polymerase sigma-70 factor, ECF subfamily
MAGAAPEVAVTPDRVPDLPENLGMRDAPGRRPASDEEIVRRVQQGEAKLFSSIFERHYGRLERFVRHLGIPESEMEDVLAETFSRAFARVQSFNPDSGTRYVSYLYAIARNLATDRLRERGRMPEIALLEDAGQEPDRDLEEPLDRVLRQEEMGRIREALERLSASDREIITLSYDRELTCREIMQVMGKPSITAVTTHLYKAMKRLRQLVLEPEPVCPKR